MSDKSTNLNKEFDANILAKARKIAEKYEIILTQEDGEWYGKGVEMPTVFADGSTPDKCIESTREALTATVAYLLEQGQVVPVSASKEKRTEQVNIRLTCEEKVILTTSARSHGYKGLGDFIRAKALAPEFG